MAAARRLALLEAGASTRPPPIAELREVRLSLGGVEVLRGIDLSIAKGEKIVLIGPSGSGKSSLIRCINGLNKPDSGQVHVFGHDIGKASHLRSARLRMEMIFQGLHLYSNRTVLENVTLAPMRLLGLSKTEAEELAFWQLDALEIAELADSYPFQLSGGQQQRVALARALAKSPDILLLDEPTSALDPELVQSVLSAIEKATDKGMTTVTVTHEIGFARRQAQRVIFICEGAIVEEGPPSDIFVQPKSLLLKSFLSHLRR